MASLAKPNAGQTPSRSLMKMRMGPSGIHLFDRMKGLNVLLDEVQVPPNLWARAPRQVSIALTNACDLSCPYCFAPKNSAWLDVDKVIGWLNELDADGCLGVGFGGGEPTLHRSLPDICHHAAKRTRMAVTFTTHAHRLDDGLISALLGSVHFVRVSMDGVGHTYEALRGRRFSEFREQLEKICILAPFGINYVVNARTLPDLDAACGLASEVGAAEILLLPEHPTKTGVGIDALTSYALRRWIDFYQGSVPLTISECSSGGLPTCDPLPRERGLLAYAHIDAQGVLKRSSYDPKGVRIQGDGVMAALELLRDLRERGTK